MAKNWIKTTEDRFDEMLGCLPPVAWVSKGFLVGEAYDHGTCKITGDTRARYTALVSHGGEFYESKAPMTIPEWKAFDPNTINKGDAA